MDTTHMPNTIILSCIALNHSDSDIIFLGEDSIICAEFIEINSGKNGESNGVRNVTCSRSDNITLSAHSNRKLHFTTSKLKEVMIFHFYDAKGSTYTVRFESHFK